MKADMNLVKLVEEFGGSDDACREFLAELRWPEGVRCPRCGSDNITHLRKRDQYDCGNDECGYRFSVTAGTIFHDSHLPLWKWFCAVYLICESKKGISANQLKRTLNVAYKTAWYLCHRIRSAMEDEGAELLSGIVEVDETYIGGKVRGKGRGPYAGGNKIMVLGAVERGGKIRLRAGGRPTSENLQAFVREVISDDTEAIFTDEAHGYGDLSDENTRHERVRHGLREYVRGDVHTNTVESAWSLFERAVMGSYHKLSAKHLPAYLDEFAFRFNNRENPFLFRDTLLRLIKSDNLTYKELTDSPQH